MRRTWKTLHCTLRGHRKLTLPDQDPDGYKLVVYDECERLRRLTINRCARCGRFYMTQQHIPGMNPP